MAIYFLACLQSDIPNIICSGCWLGGGEEKTEKVIWNPPVELATGCEMKKPVTRTLVPQNSECHNWKRTDDLYGTCYIPWLASYNEAFGIPGNTIYLIPKNIAGAAT